MRADLEVRIGFHTLRGAKSRNACRQITAQSMLALKCACACSCAAATNRQIAVTAGYLRAGLRKVDGAAAALGCVLTLRSYEPAIFSEADAAWINELKWTAAEESSSGTAERPTCAGRRLPDGLALFV
jgi:hypothetical protein